MTTANRPKDQAVEYLREYFAPGDRVYSTFISARDGAQGVNRQYRFFAHTPTGIAHVSHLIGPATGNRFNRESRTVTAQHETCEEIVIELSRALYGRFDALRAEAL